MKRREFIALAGGTVAAPSLLWSRATHAQHVEKFYRIGYLALLPGEDVTLAKPFSQRLLELGYSEGRNLRLEYRSAESRPERLAQLVDELLQANPDVLVAGFGTLTAKAAAAATTNIPIVFTSVGDPVGAGLVASLAKPGANVTGLSAQASEIAAKRIQILEDLIPRDKTIAVLSNPDTPFTASALRVVKSAAECKAIGHLRCLRQERPTRFRQGSKRSSSPVRQLSSWWKIRWCWARSGKSPNSSPPPVCRRCMGSGNSRKRED